MMRLASLLTVAGAVVLSAITVVAGQDPAPAGQAGESQEELATFKAAAEVVSISVTVTDEKTGEFVTDLTAQDFGVFEDGKQQRIVNFRGLNEEFPVGIGLGLVLDVSGSMSQSALDTMRTVVQGLFDRRIKEEDEVYLMEFAAQSRLVLPWTTEHDKVLNEIRRFKTRIGTAIYDAIRDSLPISMKGKFKKQVMLVVTDGADYNSTVNRGDLAKMAAASDVLIYAVVVDNEEMVGRAGAATAEARQSTTLRQAAAELSQVTDATGGETVYVRGFQEFENAIQKLGKNFTSQYFIEYQRDGEQDGKLHVVQVGVAKKEGRDVVVRSRTTYNATN